MKKKLILCAVLSASLITSLLGCSKTETNSTPTSAVDPTTVSEDNVADSGYKVSNPNTISLSDYFADQKSIDDALIAESEAGYTFENPQIILNPYGTSPLSAVVIFSTESETDGTVTVKGKDEKDNITGTFKKAKNHIIPIYGLYNNDTTKVEIALSTGETTELEITTEDSLSGFDLGEITATMYDDSQYDYNTLTLACSSMGLLYAMDSKGDIRWCYSDGSALGVKQLKNGHLIVPTNYNLHPTYYKSGMKEIDFSGKVYKEYAVPGGIHHAIFEMENGNFLVASEDADFSSVEDVVLEIDRNTGDVVWELDMKDLLDTTDGQSASNISDGTEPIDWFHNNSVWYDAKTDTVLLSARHVDSIVAVNKTTKELSWILGDPNGWEKTDKNLFFTPVGDNFEWQYAQHHVTVLDNGDIMLFDNGTAKVKLADNDNRVTGDDIYSRAVAYRIDTEKMTIEQVWQYGKERGPEWYSDWISGAISLDGTTNNVLITAGSNLYNPETGSYDHSPTNMFTPGLTKSSHLSHVVNNKLAFEIKISGPGNYPLTFRSFKINMYPENGTLDVTAKGDLLGGFGNIASAKVDYTIDDFKAAETNSDLTWTLDKAKLAVTGTYTDTSANAISDNYIILVDSDGNTYARKMNQSIVNNDDGSAAVTLNGWISMQSIDAKSYDIYVTIDDVLYNAGYQFQK